MDLEGFQILVINVWLLVFALEIRGIRKELERGRWR